MYLPPFDGAVRAGVLSIMCSYNRINDTYSCENAWSLNGNLKTDLGFQGWVVR
jgi:beta-glucosidase